jgi:hypothetical protein
VLLGGGRFLGGGEGVEDLEQRPDRVKWCLLHVGGEELAQLPLGAVIVLLDVRHQRQDPALGHRRRVAASFVVAEHRDVDGPDQRRIMANQFWKLVGEAGHFLKAMLVELLWLEGAAQQRPGAGGVAGEAAAHCL